MNIYAGATATKTPAHLLYEHWWKMLSDYHGATLNNPMLSMFYGSRRGIGIGINGADSNGIPLLSCGFMWGPTSAPTSSFTVNVDGEFMLPSLMHGWKDRDLISQVTFLGWEYDFSQYHWMYAPDSADGHYQTRVIRDLTKRRHYISEKPVGLREYRGTSAWMKLRPEPDDYEGWALDFAWDPPSTWRPSGATRVITQADFDKSNLQRERRYARLQRRDLIAKGLLDAKGRTIKTEEELLKERRTLAATLGAHFQVATPARTTSLRKIEEEGLWPPNGCP